MGERCQFIVIKLTRGEKYSVNYHSRSRRCLLLITNVPMYQLKTSSRNK